MDNKSTQKISRRDALKILAAVAGGAALANIPSKWTKPGLDVGVLPAHAATSPLAAPIACGTNTNFAPTNVNDTVTSSVTISPARGGVQMQYNATSLGNGYFPQSGTATTNPSGVASVALQAGCMVAGGTIQVTWSFVNPADGTGTCVQTLTSTTTVPC